MSVGVDVGQPLYDPPVLVTVTKLFDVLPVDDEPPVAIARVPPLAIVAPPLAGWPPDALVEYEAAFVPPIAENVPPAAPPIEEFPPVR